MSDDQAMWGDTCLPVVLEALGKADAEIDGVSLHFEFGQLATATFTDRDGNKTLEVLPVFGCDSSAALGTPLHVNAVDVHIAKEQFVIIECRYFPVNASPHDIVAMLRALDAATEGQ